MMVNAEGPPGTHPIANFGMYWWLARAKRQQSAEHHRFLSPRKSAFLHRLAQWLELVDRFNHAGIPELQAFVPAFGLAYSLRPAPALVEKTRAT